MDTLLDLAPCGIFLIDPQGQLLETNRAFLEMVGLAALEPGGTRLEQFLDLAGRAVYAAVLLPRIRSGTEIREASLTLLDPAGAPVPVLLNGAAQEVDGKAVYVISAVPFAQHARYEKELQQGSQVLRQDYQAQHQALDLEHRSRELFKTLLLSINEAIIVTDSGGLISLMNPLAEGLAGVPLREARGLPFEQVFPLSRQPGGEPILGAIEQVLQSGTCGGQMEDVLLRHPSGVERTLNGTANRVQDKAGRLLGAVVALHDVTREANQQRQIERFLGYNLDMLCVTDAQGNFTRVNRKFEQELGYLSADLAGRPFLDLLHPDDRAASREQFQQGPGHPTARGVVNRVRRRDGSYRDFEWFALPGIDSTTFYSARDITRQVQREQQLARRGNALVRENRKLARAASSDALTGLYNRAHLEAVVPERLAHADRYAEPLAMVLVDIDHFKQVNDVHGHPFGDRVLVQVAQTLLDLGRQSDLAFRLGGEEFLLLLPGTQLSGAEVLAEKLRQAVSALGSPPLERLSASFGVSERAAGETYEDWYRRTDAALYRAKAEGRDRVVPVKPD